MAYIRNEILRSVLFRRGISKELHMTPEQVKALRQSFKKGTIKESTAVDILQKAGFVIVQPELWDNAPKKKK